MEIQQIVSRADDPVPQDAIRQSYADLQSQISQSLSDAERANGNAIASKNALTNMGT